MHCLALPPTWASFSGWGLRSSGGATGPKCCSSQWAMATISAETGTSDPFACWRPAPHSAQMLSTTW